MDGSFALAFLVALGMTLANLALLVFGLGLFVMKRLATWRRLLFSAILSAFAIFCSLFGQQLLVNADSDQPPLEFLPHNTLPITLMTVILLGCSSFIYILVLAFRAKPSRLWSVSRWLLIPTVLVHIVLSAFAFYLTWSFAFSWLPEQRLG